MLCGCQDAHGILIANHQSPTGQGRARRNARPQGRQAGGCALMDGLVYRAAKQSEADPYEYVLSDETVDRYGEVIQADGWDLSEFKADRNPIALFNHNSDAVIGRWEKVRIEGKRLLGRLILAEE